VYKTEYAFSYAVAKTHIGEDIVTRRYRYCFLIGFGLAQNQIQATAPPSLEHVPIKLDRNML
jgi:hypothetical protein